MIEWSSGEVDVGEDITEPRWDVQGVVKDYFVRFVRIGGSSQVDFNASDSEHWDLAVVRDSEDVGFECIVGLEACAIDCDMDI